MKYIIHNGKLVKDGTAVVHAGSRGLRFGDGCFETLKAVKGKIILKDQHFGRLLSSLELLQFDIPEGFAATLQDHIAALLKKNKHGGDTRVRITLLRSDGGLYDINNNLPDYLIETWEIEPVGFNTSGSVADIYKDARKTADHFSHIKHNNFLPYVMAARWAIGHGLDDAILLNHNNRIADATRANVFIVTNGFIKTPVLSEGCIAGVMRKFIINSCRKEGIPVEETTVTVPDLQNASEVFLTNSITGIKWIREIGDHHYTCQVSKLLFNKMIKPLWA